ncbi:MAG: hypothetical protein V3U69_05020, partial [Bacteroidota bacterium]
MRSFRLHVYPALIGTWSPLPFLLFLSISQHSGLAQVIAPPDTSQAVTSEAERSGGSGVDSVVVYSASDSISYSLLTRFMKMYGKSDIKYRDLQLKAERVDVNWDTATLVAEGVLDSATAEPPSTEEEVELSAPGSPPPNPTASSFQPTYRKKYRG